MAEVLATFGAFAPVNLTVLAQRNHFFGVPKMSNDDKIFKLFEAVGRAWKEISALKDALPEAFSKHGITLREADEETLEDWGDSRYAYSFKIRGTTGKNQARTSQFKIMFDMWREHINSNWEYSRTALLTFAYEPSFEDGWDACQLAVSPDGWLDDEDMRAECNLDPSDKLVVYPSRAEKWKNKAWFFSVPLLMIVGLDSLNDQIINPVIKMIKENKSPEEAFCGSHAIKFVRPD